MIPSISRSHRLLLAAGAAAVLLPTGVAVAANPSASTPKGVCDVYAAGGTPCVAAHSTTRALFGAYNGRLYQVRRASDHATRDIRVGAKGGFADAAVQDAFCARTTCVITVIYDQSGRGNDLTQAPPGGFSGPAAGGYDNLADAAAAPVRVHGHRAYGVQVVPGVGYRNNHTNGVATGDDPEGMYAVFDGNRYNNGCCFDYGNAETDSHDDGNGTMEAIYFGTNTVWGTGTGTGPWIMADLENGLFSGVHTHFNASNKSIDAPVVTAMIKGSHDEWAIRGGDATNGPLSTFYSGARPNEVEGYNPMRKQGAILLGIGGDNSNGAAGTFYEGVMTSGHPSEATENAVQTNITAAHYQAVPVALDPGPQVSVQAADGSPRFVQHDADDDNVTVATVTRGSPVAERQDATFVQTAGLADPGCVSFESVDHSGRYLRHQNFRVHLQPDDGGSLFARDATFCVRPGNSGKGRSFESVNYPGRFLRQYAGGVYLASDGGTNSWDTATNWAADSSWLIAKPLGPQQ